jgi:SAM-dependent methyltransferase
MKLTSEYLKKPTVSGDILKFKKDFEGFFDSSQEWEWDSLRFMASLTWISTLDLPRNAKVFEMGAPSSFTKMLQFLFPDWVITHQQKDLRLGMDAPDASFDLVISMEVIEHIGDSQSLHGLDLKGMSFVLTEAFRVLKENGFLFLTTPNFCGVWNIQRGLLMQPPMLFEFHIRELTPTELSSILHSAGFTTEEHQTFAVWHHWNFDPIIEFMLQNNYSLDFRGDDQFVLAKKIVFDAS